MDNLTKEIVIIKRMAGEAQGKPEALEKRDLVTREAPLTIFLNDRELVTLLCTPGDTEDLAIGFLAAEGFLKNRSEMARIENNPGEGMVRVYTGGSHGITEQTFLKRYITTGCGRGTSFYHVQDALQIKPVQAQFEIDAGAIIDIVKGFQRRSELFLSTGGVHSAGLATAGEILLFREDVGRHNAVDKILGRAFLDGLDLSDKMLVTTGRVSSEIVIKTAKAGVPVLVSRSAPTDLGVEIAGEMGITLIGFARAQRFNIYSHAYRVK